MSHSNLILKDKGKSEVETIVAFLVIHDICNMALKIQIFMNLYKKTHVPTSDSLLFLFNFLLKKLQKNSALCIQYLFFQEDKIPKKEMVVAPTAFKENPECKLEEKDMLHLSLSHTALYWLKKSSNHMTVYVMASVASAKRLRVAVLWR